MKNLLILHILLLMLATFLPCKAQPKVDIVDETLSIFDDPVFFFTNRPKIEREDGSPGFEDKWTDQTGNLYFAFIDYETDSYAIRYHVSGKPENGGYPTGEVKDNIFYPIYDEIIKKGGIEHFHIIVPGYAKTFNTQINDFIYRMKLNYIDSLKHKAVFLTFAWGDEWRPQRYYNAIRSAKNAANDFAIFQHMLEDFLSDTDYFKNGKPEIRFNITFLSMGNQLFQQYLLNREEQNLELVRCYNWVNFFGSDAAFDSFNPGKGFHNLHKMTDSILIVVNAYDKPLFISQLLNPKARLGKAGPKNPDHVPPNAIMLNLTNEVVLKDLKGLDHDYFLTNPVFHEAIMRSHNE